MKKPYEREQGLSHSTIDQVEEDVLRLSRSIGIYMLSKDISRNSLLVASRSLLEKKEKKIPSQGEREGVRGHEILATSN